MHIVVVTLRCNQRCHYCHASSQSVDDTRWDMSVKTARQVVDKIMSTPSPTVKIEFQGGEALLNFQVIRTIVKEAKRRNKKAKKDLSFEVCTNLTLMDDAILAYLKKEDISVSTSLDGPREIHDRLVRQGACQRVSGFLPLCLVYSRREGPDFLQNRFPNVVIGFCLRRPRLKTDATKA